MMKKAKLGFGILFTMIFAMIFIGAVNAEDATGESAEIRTAKIVEALKNDVNLKDLNAKVSYEDGFIDISYAMAVDSEINEVSFTVNGDVIEYSSGAITNYEEASESVGYSMYAMMILQEVLELNGYSEEEIRTFFQSENSEIDYELNGIEIKEIGESKEFKSEDGSSTITYTPVSIKINVKRANLNTSADEALPSNSTTIEKLVEYLESDEDFKYFKDEGQILSEHEVSLSDDELVITNTRYIYNYYYISLPCEDGVLTYESDEITEYDEAETVSAHYMFAEYILNIALKLNGYTTEEIQKFFQSEDLEFDYELNGIEVKELGEEQEFTSEDGTSTISMTPMAIKIDLVKANINTPTEELVEYKVLEGANQSVNVAYNEELTFRFNIEYDTFKESGKVYVDGALVDSSNYTFKEGSTIVTFNNDYTKTLSASEHTLKVEVADGEVTTNFTIKDETLSPKTGDNILMYLGMLIVGMGTLVGISIKGRKLS